MGGGRRNTRAKSKIHDSSVEYQTPFERTVFVEPFRGGKSAGGLDSVSAQLFKRAPETPGDSRNVDVGLPGFWMRAPVVSCSRESGAPSSPPGMAPASPVPRAVLWNPGGRGGGRATRRRTIFLPEPPQGFKRLPFHPISRLP